MEFGWPTWKEYAFYVLMRDGVESELLEQWPESCGTNSSNSIVRCCPRCRCRPHTVRKGTCRMVWGRIESEILQQEAALTPPREK